MKLHKFNIRLMKPHLRIPLFPEEHPDLRNASTAEQGLEQTTKTPQFNNVSSDSYKTAQNMLQANAFEGYQNCQKFVDDKVN